MLDAKREPAAAPRTEPIDLTGSIESRSIPISATAHTTSGDAVVNQALACNTTVIHSPADRLTPADVVALGDVFAGDDILQAV